MTVPDPYKILFEPLRIGPVTTRNRFYQVPHCTGMGYELPHTLAAMRAAKAEGGWGVVNTEYASIHPTSDDSPFPSCSLWDEDDVRAMAMVAEAIQEHGALAGTQLWHGGLYAANKGTRELPLSPSGGPIAYLNPLHARTMDKADIKEFRRWQVDAAKRAERAGFDIVYVYAGHAYLPFQFITPRFNQRSDEYGGSLENRVRLFREMVEETKEAVGARCAVAVRFAVHEFQVEGGLTSDAEGREVVEMLAELPDLWDVNISDYRSDSGTSRFFREGSQEDYTSFVKQVTTKPVVGVGRYTSPDTMVSALKRGVLDLIGAARPSIADPFLPRKIEEGRLEDIRECIGCNICRATFKACSPIRCTQNPTMGEEYRRGWHPDHIRPKGSERPVLVVGAGPAGLECAMALGDRGYEVTLAEAGGEVGGHINLAAALPGLAAWARVRDHRLSRISPMANLRLYLESRLEATDILEFQGTRLVLATGSRWRGDGAGRSSRGPIPGCGEATALTPEAVLAGAPVTSPVVIFDDDHYYMGAGLAERLRKEGHDVTLVTPAPEPAVWTLWTDEHHLLAPHLYGLGITIEVSQKLVARHDGSVELAFLPTGARKRMDCASLVLVTARTPDRGLYDALMAEPERLAAAGIAAPVCLGDAQAPGLTADAVHAGHRYAEELDCGEAGPMVRRERVLPAKDAQP